MDLSSERPAAIEQKKASLPTFVEALKVLDELMKADDIICAMLGEMTPTQKRKCALKLADMDVSHDGMTRRNERNDAIGRFLKAASPVKDVAMTGTTLPISRREAR